MHPTPLKKSRAGSRTRTRKTSNSPAPASKKQNLVQELETNLRKKNQIENKITVSKKNYVQIKKELDKNSKIDIHIQELNRKVLEEKQICQLLFKKVRAEERKYREANSMLTELKNSLSFEKRNLDTVITNKINDEGLKLDTHARDLDSDICNFQRKKDDYLMELSTNITTDQEARYYKKVSEKIDHLKYELKGRKDHYQKLKDHYDHDKRRIDIKMKRVQDDYKRITRDNTTLEQDAKKGMSDLKYLQESIKHLKKQKTTKTTHLAILRSKINSSNPNPPNPNLHVPIPNSNDDPQASISHDHYYSSYRDDGDTGFKG